MANDYVDSLALWALFKKIIVSILCTLMLTSFFMSNAYAQEAAIPAAVSNAFDPGQRAQYIQETTVPRVQVPLAPTVKSEAPPSTPIAGADKIQLKLNQIIIEGNTAFCTSDLYKIFVPYIGKTISLAQLQKLVDEVTKKYRSEGYVLSRAILPAQEIKGGVVRVQVIEGFVSHIDVEGKTGQDKQLILNYTANLLYQKPLQIRDLERQMLLLNDISGLDVRAVLKPSKTVPAASDLTLVTDYKFADAYFVYDDYGSRYLGPHQIGFGGDFNSLIIPGDRNAFHFAYTSQTREMKFGEFVHAQPLNTQGTIWTLGVNSTRTQPGFVLEPAEIIGNSFSFYNNFDHSFIRSRSQNLILRGTSNYQNVTSTILGSPFYQDRFRTLGLGLYYDVVDSWKGANNVELDYMHGFPWFGAHDHFFQSRAEGQTIFNKLNLNGARLQQIKGPISAYLAVTGQYSFEPLLATQQFAYGGAIWGRGYEPSEIVGDEGLAAKFELRADTAPDYKFLKTIQFYGFYDIGKIWNISSVGQLPQLSAASSGAGMRVGFMPQVSGELYMAKPLTRRVTSLVLANENGNATRFFFQIIARI